MPIEAEIEYNSSIEDERDAILDDVRRGDLTEFEQIIQDALEIDAPEETITSAFAQTLRDRYNVNLNEAQQ